jgi:hypothetical protein
MKENYCARCDVEGVPDPVVPNRWQCPRCHGNIFALSVHERMQLEDALGMQGQSAETRDGFPVREFARHVAKDGGSSGIDIEREENGSGQVRQTLHPAAPAPRDPQGERKRAEERQAVTLLLGGFNRFHGTFYDRVRSGDDDRGDDVIAESSKEEEPDVRFQVTFADTDGKLRASIARGKAFSAEGTEEQLLVRAAAALQNKADASDPEAVLILDGGGVVTTPGTVERFAREHRQALESAPFREVWWVDHAPGGVIRRLWPER